MTFDCKFSYNIISCRILSFNVGETMQQTKEKKKMSKKKLWIIIICSILALLLIAGILIYIFIINSPLWKIYQSALNTKDRLDDLLKNGKNLTSWVDTVKQTYEDGKFTVDADYGSSKRDLSVQLQYDAEKSAMAGALSYQWGTDRTIDADFSANETDLMFRFPQLLNKTFSVPLENLGEESANNSYLNEYLPDWVQALDGLDPDLFTDITWQTYKEEHEDEIDELIDSIEIDEVDEQIEHAKGLTTYRLKLDTPLFTELFLDYLHLVNDTRLGEDYASKLDRTIAWFEKILVGNELTFYVGINSDDCLTAFHLLSEGKEDTRLTIVLSGGENVWNDFGIWVDGEEKYAGGLTAQKNALELKVNQYTARCEDAKQNLYLLRDQKEILSMRYENNGKNAKAAIVFGQKELDISMAPYEKPVRMISDDPTDLFDMGILDWLEVVAVLVKENLL